MKISAELFRGIGLAVTAAALILTTLPAHAETNFVRIPTQYIAALADPQASSGTDAETWGLWEIDPGPRGVYLKDYVDLVANAAVAPPIRRLCAPNTDGSRPIACISRFTMSRSSATVIPRPSW